MSDPPVTGLSHAKLDIDGDGPPIPCWFNPKEYTIAKSNAWTPKTVVGKSFAPPQYGGGQPRKLTLQLLFDSTDTPSTSADFTNDVTKVTNRLFRAMEPSKSFGGGKNSARPPMVTFIWGKTVSFKSVIESLSVQFTLFDSSGKPVRAQAQLALTQMESSKDDSTESGAAAPQNPTTRAQPGLGSHTVRDGDSLASIAFHHYRDPARWRAIAEANGIDDPLHLKRGTALSIPRIEE